MVEFLDPVATAHGSVTSPGPTFLARLRPVIYSQRTHSLKTLAGFMPKISLDPALYRN